jgi:hypothetical protein
MAESRYVFDNAGTAETGLRFSGLEATFDSAARRLESTRQQRRVMIFIRSQEDGMIHSVRLPRPTSRSS